MATTQITEQMVNAAQQAWCDGLAYLGTVDAEGGDVRAAAGTLVDALYDYAEGTVFFKPTMALARTPSAAPDGARFPTSSAATAWDRLCVRPAGWASRAIRQTLEVNGKSSRVK
jgi:hypothetical protein